MSDDSRAAIRVAVSTTWRRRSDDTIWYVKEFRRAPEGRNGFTLRRIRMASEPQSELPPDIEDFLAPDLAALREHFAVYEARIPFLTGLVDRTLPNGEIIESPPDHSVGYAFPPGEPLPAGRYEVPREKSHEVEVGEVFIDREEVRKLEEHPAPWPPEWNVTRVSVTQGAPLQASVSVEATCHANGSFAVDGSVERLSVLLQVAPEMETLLRRVMEAHGMCLFCGPVDDPLRDHPGHMGNKIRGLLNRIDKASK